MIKKVKVSIVLIILMLTSALSIFVLSNGTNATGDYIGLVNLGINSIQDCKNTYEYAWWIANNVEDYMNASNEDIFNNINSKSGNQKKGKLSVNNVDAMKNGSANADAKGKVDVWYYTASCMAHNTMDLVGGNSFVQAQNIIYLETPGKIIAYRRGSSNSVTVDFTNYDTAENIYQKINGSTATFSADKHEEMLKNISMFIYATTKYTENGYIGIGSNYYNKKVSEEGEEKTLTEGWLLSGASTAETIAKYYWWEKGVQQYIKEGTNILHEHFHEISKFAEEEKEKLTKWNTFRTYQTNVNSLLVQPTVEKLETGDESTVELKNGKAYIGPFKANYAGGTPSIQVGGAEVKWVTKNSDDGSYNEEQESSQYVSGQEFYAVLDQDSVQALTSVNVKLKINYSKCISKLSLFSTVSGSNQALMYHAGNEDTGSKDVSWTVDVDQETKITIQKQTESGANLKKSGIEFKVYNSNNNLVGTLTTDQNGRTGSLELEPNSTYTIKEVSNGAYGYKGCNITGATITSGSGTIVSSSSEEVKVKITSNATIAIKNKKELGNITIHKKGENNSNLAGVEFALWKGVTGYLMLYEKGTTNFIKKIETTTSGLDLTQYTMDYTTNVNEATKFKTNSSGKIIIKNLEIYYDQSTMYRYWIQEISNNNYGYKNMEISTENVSITGGSISEIDSDKKQVKVHITGNTTVTITNHKELGNITIIKKGENNTNLRGVEFAIWQSKEGNLGYLRLYEKGTENPIEKIPATNSEIDITAYTVGYTEFVSNATKFETNSSGKIVIKNLEVYSGVSTKYSYCVKETNNSNYGYKNMEITKENVKLEGATPQGENEGVSAIGKWVQFEINDNTENVKVTITNPKQLGNITIIKKGENNTNLSGVEFAIWQSRDGNLGYLRLYEKGTENPIEKIPATNSEIDITAYTVGYTEFVSNATKFETNSSGKIVIKNLEVYSGVSTKYSYCVKETSNSNYGYKNMEITKENVKLEGATPQGENEGVSASGKWVQFEINDNTENVKVTITNPKKLANIIIHKVGDSSQNLKDVEFVIWTNRDENLGYLRLYEKGTDNPIEKIDTTESGIDITAYTLGYTKYVENATKFKTNTSGKIIVKNLEVYSGVSTKYNYCIKETSNSNYGYKNMEMTKDNVKLEGGTPQGENEGVSSANKWVQFTINDNTENVTVTITNIKKLGKITIQKEGENEKLEGVEFAIWQNRDESLGYLRLYEKGTDNPIEKIDATESEIDITTYTLGYTKYVDNATKFKTNSNGKIIINNLEIYKNTKEKYEYWIQEISNNNYGYKNMGITTENVSITGGDILKVDSNQKQVKVHITNNTIVIIKNSKLLGNIQLTKYESAPTKDKSILIPNVEFVIEASQSSKNKHSYIALYDKNGKIVSSVRGTVTINNKNKAKADGTEYEVRYYYIDKEYSKLTNIQKANITTFITGDDGKLTIKNLEVYQPLSQNKCEYKLIEINNPNYGYVVESPGLVTATLEENKTTKVELGNKLVYTKVSGYVWIENLSEGKVNEYDCLYTTGSTDEKLTNLVKITENNELVFKPNNNELKFKNGKDSVTIKIQLRDKEGTVIKEKPDQFDENGKYTFIDVEVENLANYEVVFEYDGFYYTTTLQKLNEDNGAKVKENTTKREDLNNSFASVQAQGIVSKEEDVNKVEYIKDGNISTVSDLELETNISANTNEAYLSAEFSALNRSTSNLVNEVENVNMGIILREQPHISINSDIYSVLLNFADYNYNYKYNGRQNYYENKDNNEIGVKFEEKFAPTRYTRAVFASDIQAVESGDKEIKVSITYKIQVANQSVTLSVNPTQIINYFDSRYTLKAVGLGLDETTHTITNAIGFSEPQSVIGQPEYKSTVIDFNQLIQSGNENVVDLYITFEMSTETEEGKEAIFGLLNEESTYHNASEILSYATYYGNETSLYITDKTAPGKVYAGIDKMSQPGNMKLELVEHPTIAGTDILNTEEYEDDTTSAPSLVLQVQESRTISGTIWEDIDQDINDNEKIGNGILDPGEKPIAGVQVALYEVDNNGNPTDVVAKYSNGQPVTTTTGEDGSYTFGKYTENGSLGEFYGVLPGKYVIKYTYNNQSYIVDATGNTYLNVNDYKSTIIKEDGVIDKAIKNQDITYNGVTYYPEKWYTITEENRYSDATDNIDLRKAMDENVVKYSTYADAEQETYVMEAYTPVMDIGIEFTRENIAEVLTSLDLLTELKNIDFGIIERPNTNVVIEKQVTSMELTANNGANIIPKGDPSDINSTMQYVKKLDGLVSAEVESSLLQSAVLKLEYTVKVRNNSQEDYLEDEYYIYGTNGITPRTVKVEKVADYLDNTMTPDFEQTEDGVWIETTADKLYTDGYISQNVRNELNTGEYHIFYTTIFNEVEQGEEKSVKFHATKTLSVSDSTAETNRVEIIELSGGRTIKTSIPGNYIPSGSPTGEPDPEPDTSVVKVVITPATGTTVNYILYIIAAIVTFTILVSGIVIIKKKIIK